jgi:uncharacterized membrane protein YbhN (UPF0104 family)
MRAIGSWLIGFSIVAVIFWQVDKASLSEALSNISPSFAILAVLSTLPMIAIKAVRWHLLLGAIGINYPAHRALLSFLVSLAFSVLTPGRVGEIYRAWPAAKYCNSAVSRASSSVVLDRFFDLFVLIGIAILGLFITPGRLFAGLAFSLLLFLCLCFSCWFLARTFPVSLLENWPKVMRAASEFQTAFVEVPPRIMTLSFFLTFLSYGFYFAIILALASIIGIDAAPVTICFAVAIGGLAAMLPISVSGLGTRDASIVFLLGQAGVTSSKALGLSMAIFIVFYLSALFFGLTAWIIEQMMRSGSK